MNLTFYIVDVFAEEKYAGNQLAVVRGGAGLPDETLQKIALERNYSETTFVLSEEETEGGYDVRIFTPGDEIPVTFGEVLWMRQLQPTFGAILDSALFARTLNLETADLDDRSPVQEVSTGLPALIVPLRDLDALRRCKVDWERYTEAADPGKNLYVFCPESHDDGPGDLSARMFANDPGVPEDPATGSAAGCLAAYLLGHAYLGTDSIDVRVEQGYEIGRPSLLYLQAARDGDQTTVHVGGKVQMVARGELV